MVKNGLTDQRHRTHFTANTYIIGVIFNDRDNAFRSIAIMVADGFDEKNFIEIQKMLMGQNAQLKVTASTGLVQGRTGTQLGMPYPVDPAFRNARSCFDALIIPSGAHLAALAEELHAARIIKAFKRKYACAGSGRCAKSDKRN